MVTLKADDRQRVKLPNAKPGEVFIYTDEGNGRMVLTLVKPVKRARRGSRVEGLRPLTKAESEECWGAGSDKEHDALVAHCAGLRAGSPPE